MYRRGGALVSVLDNRFPRLFLAHPGPIGYAQVYNGAGGRRYSRALKTGILGEAFESLTLRNP